MIKFLAVCVALASLGALSLLATNGARGGDVSVSGVHGRERLTDCRWARAPRPPFDQRWRCF